MTYILGTAVGSVIGMYAAQKTARYMMSNWPLSPPQYGSVWHHFQHWRGQWEGQIAFVPVHVVDTNEDINAFGHVCHTCGFVNINRQLDLALSARVDGEIFGRSTRNFCWALSNNVPRRT